MVHLEDKKTAGVRFKMIIILGIFVEEYENEPDVDTIRTYKTYLLNCVEI